MGIEELGAIVRGPYGSLSRIVAVHEHSRAPLSHLIVEFRGAVVVALDPIGPSYGHRSAWSSDLTLAELGDRGAHPCSSECECGDPTDEPPRYFGGRYRAASWLA